MIDLLYQIHIWAYQVLQKIHPNHLKTTEDLANQQNEQSFKFIEAFFFSIGILLFVSGSLFLVVRTIWNGCGADGDFTKIHYSRFKVVSLKVLFGFFSFLIILVLGFGLAGNQKFSSGVQSANDIYQRALPPLSEPQASHLKSIYSANRPLFSLIDDKLQSDLSNLWKAGMSGSVIMTLSMNMTDERNQILNQLNDIHFSVEKLIQDKLGFNDQIFAPLDQVQANTAQTAYQQQISNIVSAMKSFYNFSDTEQLISQLNAFGKFADNNQPFLGIRQKLNDSLQTENILHFGQDQIEKAQEPLNDIFFSLTKSSRACEFAASDDSNAFAVLQGAEVLVPFHSLMDRLSSLGLIAMPALYSVSALAFLCILLGGYAFPSQSYQAMKAVAVIFTLTAIAAFMMNGFFVPTSIMTNEACENPNFFNTSMPAKASLIEQPKVEKRSFLNSFNFRFPFFSNNNSTQTTSDQSTPNKIAPVNGNIPTCAICEKSSLFKDWDNLAVSVQNVSSTKLDLIQLWQPQNQLASLSAFEDLNQYMTQNVLQQPGTRPVWQSDLQSLIQQSSNADASVQKEVKKLSDLSGQFITNLEQFYFDYALLKQNVSLLMKPIGQLKSLMQSDMKTVDDSIQKASQPLQDYLTSLEGQYKEVPAEITVNCSPAAVDILPEQSVLEFKNYLCQDVRVGLDLTWSSQFILGILYLPLIFVAFKSFKYLGFASVINQEIW